MVIAKHEACSANGAMVGNCRKWFSTVFIAVVGCALFSGSQANADYHLFDNFEDEILGPIGGQDGWVSGSSDNQVVSDPGATGGQSLYVPSNSSTLRKSLSAESLGILDGTSRMMFLRFRIGAKQTLSFGLSYLSSPSEYSDFGPEIGTAGIQNDLDLRVWDDDGGNYETMSQLTPDTWINLWVYVDSATNSSEIWMNNSPFADATAADKLSATDGDDTFDFRSGDARDLITFYIKTSGGSSGENFGPVYFDDIYLEQAGGLNLANPIPEPSSVMLLGLMTFGLMRRMRRVE